MLAKRYRLLFSATVSLRPQELERFPALRSRLGIHHTGTSTYPTLPVDSSAQLISKKRDSSQIRSQPNPFSSLST